MRVCLNMFWIKSIRRNSLVIEIEEYDNGVNEHEDEDEDDDDDDRQPIRCWKLNPVHVHIHCLSQLRMFLFNMKI